MQWQIYYHTISQGEAMRQAVENAHVGSIAACRPLPELPPPQDIIGDIVLLEYDEKTQGLDNWVQQVVDDFQGPSVFLVFPRESSLNLLKALTLGVHGYFTFPLDEAEIRETVDHVTGWNRIKSALLASDGPMDGGCAPAMA
jgi:AmiR/NasT family two-component response regulator